MKLCIYGAGAIGGLLGTKLALAGYDVTLIARGPHLAAIQKNGISVVHNGETLTAHPAATDDPADAGPQDYVIVTLKAQSVSGVVDAMQPLLGPNTTVVWGVNGVPWWYFYGLDGPYRDRRLESVDPGGVQWDGIGPQRILASVVYPAAEVSEPGIIRHIEGDRFSLGEPDGSKSQRSQDLAHAFVEAGFRAPLRPHIRDEMWVKLWGNMSFNPISALTGGTLERIATDPEMRDVVRTLMLEAKSVGEALGVNFPVDVDNRIDGAAKIGAHKTSMLQDLERGRPMEIDALVGAVAEMGRLTGIAMPTLDTVLALVRMRARITGCYPG